LIYFYLQAFKKIDVFQWVASHAGLEGNEVGDKLTKKGTALRTVETQTQADSLRKFLNRKIDKKYKREDDELTPTTKWRDIKEFWVGYKGKPRKKAVANVRLKTGHDCLAAL